MRAPRVILAILDSDPRTSVTTSSICFLHLARYGPMKPLVMDCETSVVQWIWEAASTTWPGHCRTHSLRGTVGYCFTALIITCRKLSFITSSTCRRKHKVKFNSCVPRLLVLGNVKLDFNIPCRKLSFITSSTWRRKCKRALISLNVNKKLLKMVRPDCKANFKT